MQVVQDEVAIDVLPAIIDGICGEVGELQEGFDDKKAGFYAPAFAVYFAEFRPVILLFIEQGGEQDFGFAIGQGNTDKAVGDGSVRWNRDAQHGQCPDGLYSRYGVVLNVVDRNTYCAMLGLPSRWKLKVIRDRSSSLYCSMFSKKSRIARRNSLNLG